MSVNLQLLETLIEKLKKIWELKIVINVNINSNNTAVNITETKDKTEIKKVWPAIVKDIQVHKGNSSEEFWMHVDLKGTPSSIPPIFPHINIGKYYICKIDPNKDEKIIFWIGAEVSQEPNEKANYYVYLFITKTFLEGEGLNPEKICGVTPHANGAYVIKIDEFSNNEKSELELKDALDKKLQAFLCDIYQSKA